MKKRLLAWLLSLSLMVGLLPVSAFAADPLAQSLDGNDSQMQVEQSTVTVEYENAERSAATITYHKEGIEADPFNLIFLVDTSKQGVQSHAAFEKMMNQNGISYIYDYGAASTVQLITYQNAAYNTGILSTKDNFMYEYRQHGVSGEGTANEPVALETAISAVRDAHAENGYPTVVFWVLGEEFGETDTSKIEEKLQELDTVLRNDTDALITWQYAAQPNALLEQYATQHTEAHDESGQKYPAAHAANDSTLFQEEMAADLEEIVHDHYHNISFSLMLDDNQTLVKSITNAWYEAGSTMASLTATPREDGKGLDVYVERLCRQIALDFVIEVELDTNIYEEQTVIPAGAIIADHEGGNGGLHTGLFDEQIAYGLELDLPAAVLDRTAHDIIFQNADGVQNITNKLTGETVTLPSGSSVTQEGSSFGGWNVVSGANRGYHYAPGEIITVPSGDMVLEPAYGYVEVDLEIDYQQGEVPADGNQMKQSDFFYNNPLDFYGVTLSVADGGQTIGEDSIVSVSVIDFLPEYDIIEQDQTTDPMQVTMTNVEDVVYARHIGATENDKVVAYLTPSATHAGKFDMVIAGPGGVKAPANSSYLFSNNSTHNQSANFLSMSLKALDTSGVTNMSNMFASCNLVTELDLSSWDTSKVTDMSSMFSYCNSLTNLNLGNFDTSSAVLMNSMFYSCQKLSSLDVSGWNTSKVTNMSNLFYLCSSLTELNVSEWDTSSVTNMSALFRNCSSLTGMAGVNGWDTSKVTNMSGMFVGCNLTGLDLSSWDTSKVTNMSSMFSGCDLTDLTSINRLNTSSVTNMSSMFYGSNLTGLDLSGWNVSNVTNMKQMFYNCSSETLLNLSGWNAANVTDMSGMFQGCKLTSLDLSSWSAPKVSNMANMFRECPNLTTLNLSGFQASGITNMNRMFYESPKLTSLDMDGFDTSLVTDMGYLFDGCAGLTSVQLSNWDTSKVLKMDWTFGDCSALTSLNLSGWDTSSVTTMHQMFTRCSSLTGITFGDKWSASSVTTMYSMFQGCSSLTSLDLSSFNTANVTDMQQMFSGCSQLSTLDLGENFTIANVSAMRLMFSSCTNLQTITGIKLGETNVATTFYNNGGLFEGLTKLTSVTFITPESGAQFPNLSSMQNMFKGCSSLTSVDLGNWILPNLTNTSYMFSGCSLLNNIDLAWSGIRASESSFNANAMFNSVPSSAALEIGTDTSQPAIQKIAKNFTSGTITSGGSPYTLNAANIVPNQLPETIVDSSEQTVEQDGVTDSSEQATEEPEQTSEEPEQTPDEPEQTPDEPEQTPEEPEQTPDEPEQAPDEPEQAPAESEQTQDVSEADAETEVSISSDAVSESEEELADMPISTALMDLPRSAAANSTTDGSVDLYKNRVKAGDTITYKITAKYTGDVGAKSDRITLTFPIPEDIQQFQGDGTLDPGWYVVRTDIDDSGAPTGFMGGRVVTEPAITTVDGKYVLQGVFEGLYTGTEITVSLMTTVQAKAEDAYDKDGYAFYDATAYVTDNAGTAVSKTVRLWTSIDEAAPPPGDIGYQLSYVFTGESPKDAVLPAARTVSADAVITTATQPSTTLPGYTFDGWYRSDTKEKINPNGQFTMPAADLTLTGKWTLSDEYAQKVTVKYEYTNQNDLNHIPEGAPALPEDLLVRVGQTYYIQKISTDADHHKFGGWVPYLTIDGQEIALTKQNDGTYTDAGKLYSIDMANSALSTEQFRDKGDVVITFRGAWIPYSGIIYFNSNGGEGDMSPMLDVTWDTTQTLTKNTFTYPLDGYQFMGWAKSPAGAVIKADGARADGLIDEDGKEVTLYAVWKYEQYGIAYDLQHVTSSNTETSVMLGGQYTTTLTAEQDYTIADVYITMGGVAITNQVYEADTGLVSIDNVTGNILIRAEATTDTGSGGGGGGGGGGGAAVKYPVIVESTGNGMATADKAEAAAGENVTITTTGTVENIAVIDKNGNGIELTDNGNGSYTFKMVDSSVTVKVEFEPLPEVADPNDTGVADWLDTVNHNSYLNGYPDGTFHPDGNMTRAEAAQMFYNLLLNKDVAITVSFSDVKAESWYATAVNTLASMGIITGVGNEQFAPERAITRAEFTAIAMRFAKLNKTGINIFSDVKESDWFYDYVVGSIQYGWITGYSDGTFRPNNTISRAEVTAITNRMLGRSADESYIIDHTSELKLFSDVSSTHWAYYQIVEATNGHDYVKTDGVESWNNLK